MRSPRPAPTDEAGLDCGGSCGTLCFVYVDDVLMIGTASSDFEYSEETVSSMAFDDNLGTRAIDTFHG